LLRCREFGCRLAGRTRRAFSSNRSSRWRQRSILATQDNDFNSAQVIKKHVVGFLNLLSRHQFQARERPVPSQKSAISLLRLLLSDAEVDFNVLGRDTLARNLEAASVAIALILAIHVDKHGETRRDVTLRSEVDAEVYFFVGDSDVAGHMAVTVVFAVLGDFGVRAAQFDSAGELFERWHDEGAPEMAASNVERGCGKVTGRDD
jgi:hypothetical protein